LYVYSILLLLLLLIPYLFLFLPKTNLGMSANRASRKRNAGDSSGAEDSHQQQQRQV
jgi:hypothetical protein